MTAQIPDQVVYEKQEYSLIGVAGGPLPKPWDFGVYPGEWSTACYRGYIMTYRVRRNQLMMSRVELGQIWPDKETNKYPTINDVKPRTVRKWEFGLRAPLFERYQYTGRGWWLQLLLLVPTLQRFPDSDSFVYDKLRLKVDFSGGLLLGSGFIRSTYVHMGHRKPYQFEHVTELLFERGNLIEVVDHSEKAAQWRDHLEATRAGDGTLKASDRSLGEWIDWRFRMDYDNWF